MSLIRLLRKHFGFTAPPYQNEEISNGDRDGGGMTLPFSADSPGRCQSPKYENGF